LYFPFWVWRFPPLLFVQMGFQLSKELFFFKLFNGSFLYLTLQKKKKWMSHQPNRKTLKPHVFVVSSWLGDSRPYFEYLV
jgi:hypothetical protein